MSAPNYSPASGYGTLFKAPEGNYLYGQNGWYQISSNSVAPAPKPKVPVVPTTQNIPAPASPQTSQPNQPSSAPAAPPDLTNEINAAYDPLLATLNSQMDQLRNVELPASEASLATQKTNLLSAAETNAQPVEQGINQAQTANDSALAQAMAQMTRDYGALRQQGQTLYGQGSSTGGAVSDILQQQFLANRGSALTTHMTNAQTLSNQIFQLHSTLASTKNQIEASAAAQKDSLDREFEQQLRQIELNKVAAESAKTQQKLALLTSYQQAFQTLAFNKVAAEQELGIWFRKEQQTVTDQLALLQKQFTNSQIGGITSGTLPQIGGGNTSATTQQLYYYNPNTGRYDPYQDLIQK